MELLAHNGHRLSVGVSDPESMVAGELTLMAATGRSPDGTMQYAEKRYSTFKPQIIWKTWFFSQVPACPLSAPDAASYRLISAFNPVLINKTHQRNWALKCRIDFDRKLLLHIICYQGISH